MTVKKRDLASFKAAMKKNTSNNNNFQNNYYPFYNIGDDEKCVVRFIPDKNEDNELAFLVEKLTHELTIDGQKKVVPCLKMTGSNECPICKHSAALYKEENKVEGKRLYRKRQHIGQVLVVEDPLSYKEGEVKAVGTVKLMNVGYSIHQKIDSAYDDDEMDSFPDDYNTGFDFIIRKVKKGDHANYENSSFSRRSRALTDEEIAVAEEARVDLSTLLPKPMTAEELATLLDQDLNGTKSPSTSNTRTTDSSSSIDPQSNTDAVASFKANQSDDTSNTSSDDPISEDVDDILADLKRMKAAQKAG